MTCLLTPAGGTVRLNRIRQPARACSLWRATLTGWQCSGNNQVDHLAGAGVLQYPCHLVKCRPRSHNVIDNNDRIPVEYFCTLKRVAHIFCPRLEGQFGLEQGLAALVNG